MFDVCVKALVLGRPAGEEGEGTRWSRRTEGARRSKMD